MRLAVVALLACSSSPPVHPSVAPPLAAPSPAISDAAIDSAPDDDHAAAVPLPKEDATVPVEELDTTVAAGDLPTDAKGWNRVEQVARDGGQLVALYAHERKLQLAIVEDQNGIQIEYPLGTLDATPLLHTPEGEVFTPADHYGASGGPILFAVRVRSTAKEPLRQLVVYTAGSSLRVVQRTLGTTTWTRVLRLDLRSGATFVGIGTTDPH